MQAMTEPGSATMPVADAGVQVPIPPRGQSDKPTVGHIWRERIATLFLEEQVRPGIGRRWHWVVLAVVVGALISLARVPSGPGVLNTIWAEDGSNFLGDALNRNLFKTILRPHNGYFVMVTRMLAIPASRVPIEWGPAVLTVEAALVTGLMAVAVYLASRQYLRHPLARLIAAVPVLAVPVGDNIAASASNNVATLQFAAVYMALWMVLWVPARRGARIASALAVLAVSLSTFLAVVLLPLALLRLYARRDAISATMVGGLLVGLVGNVTALALHLTARPVMLPSRWDPIWALSTAADWALPHALFGYGITGNGNLAGQGVEPSWLIVASWPIVAAIILVAALRLTRPQWKLAAVMGIVALAMVCGTLMQYGGRELRYVVGPELMLFAALAALLLPRPDRPRLVAWAPLVTLSVCVALVFAFSYHTAGARTHLAPWNEGVAKARILCQQNPSAGAVYLDPGNNRAWAVPSGTSGRYLPAYGFNVPLPCNRLR
jgi:hypothetical protein